MFLDLSLLCSQLLDGFPNPVKTSLKVLGLASQLIILESGNADQDSKNRARKGKGAVIASTEMDGIETFFLAMTVGSSKDTQK